PQRGGGEQDQPGDGDGARSDLVAESAREQQRDDIREQVGAGHPDDLVGGGAELGDEGVRGHRHDRLIHQDHEEPDDEGRESLPRVPLGDHGHAIAPLAASNAAPTRYRRSSASAGAMICRPAGSPSIRPDGTDIPQWPARFSGNVHRSNRYMATGSATLSPRGNAVVGVVGETSTSTFSYAASKSRAISVRIFC